MRGAGLLALAVAALLAGGGRRLALLLLLLLLPRRARRALPAEGKAVLITGCDKGFGHALAKQLHAKGFTVFAGCLLVDENGDGARELKNMKSDRMKVIQMDVCSDQEVAQAVDFVKRTLKEPEEGEKGSLWLLSPRTWTSAAVPSRPGSLPQSPARTTAGPAQQSLSLK